jgi:S1-C subfamily serine protease
LGFCAGSRPDGSIQFSAAVTPGTIGGGVFDLSGRLLGTVIGGIGGGRLAETGLAVPAHQLPATVNYLLTNGDRVAGFIGITTADIEIVPGIELIPPIQPASSGGRRQLLVERGTIITEVVENSPAARSGLRQGDLLFSVGSRIISSALELVSLVRDSRPGSTIELGFVRNNRPYLARLTVGKRQLTMAGGLSEEWPATHDPTLSRDSLQREVEQLKRSLHELERRLRRLGP